MWTFWKDFFRARFAKRNWTNRKIAFVSILIATSVAFTLIMTTVVPPLIWPSLRIAVGGLPVKITGYIFGPIVGGLTGAVSDLLTFAFRPTYFHYGYILSLVLMGVIPGIFGYIMQRRWRSDFHIANNEKINKVNLLFTVATLIFVALTVVLIIYFLGDQLFEVKPGQPAPLITNKWIFMGIAVSGIASMLVGMFVIMFFVKKSTFNTILPIIAFSAFLEVAVTPLITLGDVNALQAHSGGSFATVMSGHFIFAPVKIWVNLIVVFTAYKIVAPLIYNKEANGWR